MNGRWFASLIVAATPAAAQTTLHVDDDGDCSGSSPCHASVEAALEAAPDGATIRIHPGTYGGDIRLLGARGLTLAGTEPLAAKFASRLVLADYRGLHLENLDLDGGLTALRGDGLTVVGVRFGDRADFHICRDTELADNDFTAGAAIAGALRCEVRDNRFSGDLAFSDPGGTAEVQVARNRFAAADLLFHSERTRDSAIVGNEFVDGSIRFEAREIARNVVSDNRVAGGVIAMVAASGVANEVVANVVTGGAGCRIQLEFRSGGGNVVRGNGCDPVDAGEAKLRMDALPAGASSLASGDSIHGPGTGQDSLHGRHARDPDDARGRAAFGAGVQPGQRLADP